MKKYLFVLNIFLSLITFAQTPTFDWVKSYGGNSGGGTGSSICHDQNGNVITAGSFGPTVDFNIGVTPNALTSVGQSDIFVMKSDATGELIWIKQFAGTLEYDFVKSVVTDISGNIYVIGHFEGTIDCDPGIGVFNLIGSSIYDTFFVLKLDINGNFVWAKRFIGTLGSNSLAGGSSIAVDALGNVYGTGHFSSTIDFDPNAGVYNLVGQGSGNTFIFKLSSLGNLVWAKSLGSANFSTGLSVNVDNTGNVYTTGFFYDDLDVDPSSNINNLYASSGVGRQTYVSKLDKLGNYVWAKKIAGSQNDVGYSIATDVSGNVLVTGFFEGNGDFDPSSGIYNLTSIGNKDVFISKLDSLGNLLWAHSIGSQGYDLANIISSDLQNNIYVVGTTKQGKFYFNLGVDSFNLNFPTFGEHCFIAKFDPTGNFIWASGINHCFGYGLTISSVNEVYTCGSYYGPTDFNIGIDTFNLSVDSIIYHNIFIHKINQSLVGIEEFKNEDNSNIYPNPNNGIFTIDIKSKSNIIITNILGQEIYNENKLEGKQIIQTPDIENGLYTLTIIDNKKRQTFKLIKQ